MMNLEKMKQKKRTITKSRVKKSLLAATTILCLTSPMLQMQSVYAAENTTPAITIEKPDGWKQGETSYQGFNMRIQFDSWSKEFILSVKHESVAKVRLGADALGNITRINNLLESYPEKLAEAEQRLETVQEQMTNAKEEVGKPFPKEEELNQKLERLSELNALLNMDEREDTETEQSESKEKEERPARGSIHEKLQIYKEKSQRESETGKETRKRDFGLE